MTAAHPPAAPPPTAHRTPPTTSRSQFAVLLTASLVSSLIMLDSNIVAVALPSIARSLDASFAEVEWVVSSYIVCFAALLLAAGSLADLHGRKRMTLIGIAVFGVASAACGLASSAIMLDVARAVQGVGASLLLTAALAVINEAFVGPARARAYAFWGACLGIAITCGPIVGGVITSLFGWRWAFLINLPLCAALFYAARSVIHESTDPDAKRIDGLGILTFSAGLILLVWGLIDGNAAGWTSAPILERLAGALGLLAAFVVVELRQPRPMVDLSLFRRPTFLGSTAAMFGYAAGAQVMIFYLPLYAQNAYGFAPARAGLAMLPFAIPMFLAPRAGAALARQVSGRTILALGLAVTVCGDLLMWALSKSGQPYTIFSVAMIVAGTGAGLLNGETAKVMQGAVPAQRAGMGSGVSATVRFTALLIGIASLGAVLAHTTATGFADRAEQLGVSPAAAVAAARRVTSGDLTALVASFPVALQAPLRDAGHAAFAGGFAAASLLAAVLAAAAALVTAALVRASETAPSRVPTGVAVLE
ncbi:MAG TPA: MFS transporter [Kofleriaceae bacterium]|nr:MFS transporter [Kofleriaceae bacterium]